VCVVRAHAVGVRQPVVPQPEPAEEGVGVVAPPRARREGLQELGVPAAHHHVVGLQRRLQALRDVRHVAAPPLLAEALEAAPSHVVLVGAALPVRQVRELHRLEDAIDDHRRSETGAEAQEQHPAAPVAAERLHGRIVDDPHGAAEGPPEIEAHPATAQVVRLGHRAPVDDHPGKADRHHVVAPAGGEPLDLRHHA